MGAQLDQPVLLMTVRCLSPTGVKDLKDSLKAVADVVEQLRANGKTLRDGLQEARQSLTDAKAQCDSDPASVSAGACASIPAGDTLQADADYTKVSVARPTDQYQPSPDCVGLVREK